MQRLIQPTRHTGTTFPVSNGDLNRLIDAINLLEENIKAITEIATNLTNKTIELESKINDLSIKKQTKK